MTKKQTILVVDDDAIYRKMVTFQLTKAGYEVLIANDGREAISWIRYPEHRPDLVLLDLLMPLLSGIEVLETIKNLSYKLLVILVSGAEWPIAREGIALSSPDAFFKKPFSMQELLAKIKTLLEVSGVDEP